MISLFSHAISALLSKLFDKWTNKYQLVPKTMARLKLEAEL